jgi:hypothetical protein
VLQAITIPIQLKKVALDVLLGVAVLKETLDLLLVQMDRFVLILLSNVFVSISNKSTSNEV